MRLVRIARETLRQEALELELHLRDSLGVEQLAKVLAAEQLGEKVAVERERLGATLGQGRVPLVHELRDVGEQERGRKGRCALRVHRDDPHLAGSNFRQQVGEGRHVEVVAHHLAPRFGEDREVGIAARDLEQVRAPLALLPQGCALAGAPSRQQQRARGVLTEPRGEQGRPRKLRRHQRVHLLGVEQQLVELRWLLDVG